MPIGLVLSCVLSVAALVSGGSGNDSTEAAKPPDLLASLSESSQSEAGANRSNAPKQDVLQGEWSYTASEGWRAAFRGVGDRDSNLYWAECNAQWVCDIVSASSDGRIRFRAAIPGTQPSARFERGHLIVAGDLVIEGIEQGIVRAFRTSDGSEAWSRDLRARLCSGARSSDLRSTRFQSLTSGGHGDLFVEVNGDPCASGSRGHWIVSLSAITGVTRWSRQFDRAPSELIADEQGNLFFRAELLTTGRGYRPYLMSLSTVGRENWRREVPWASLPVATYRGWLFDANREVWQSATGTQAFRLPVKYAWSGQRNAYTLIGLESAFVIGRPKEACPPPGCSLALYGIDLPTGQVSFSVVLAGEEQVSITQPILTSERTILFAQFDESNALLREFSRDGTEIRSAPLPPYHYAEAAALVDNRWVAAVDSPAPQIRAFDLGPKQPSRTGWMSAGGNLGCAGLPESEYRAVAARQNPRR